jgi:hypothetical protein
MRASKKPIAWSYSAINSYETCPKKHYHTRVKKDFKEEFGGAALEGSVNHDHFEKYMIYDTPLPLDLMHHKKFLDPLKKANGAAFGEQKLAINPLYEPTGFFDDDVYARAIVDYMKVSKDIAVIVDWKFGKRKDDFTQLQLFAAFVSVFLPQVNTFRVGFYWAKEKKYLWEIITRDEIMEVWNGILPRVHALETAIKTTDFPPTESGLCKKYCPVTTCPHNGGYQ